MASSFLVPAPLPSLLLTWLSTRLSNCGGRKERVRQGRPPLPASLPACLLLTDPHLYTALHGLVSLGNDLIWLMASHVWYSARRASQSGKDVRPTSTTSKTWTVWRETTLCCLLWGCKSVKGTNYWGILISFFFFFNKFTKRGANTWTSSYGVKEVLLPLERRVHDGFFLYKYSSRQI